MTNVVVNSIELSSRKSDDAAGYSSRFDAFGFPLHDALLLLPTSLARPLATKASSRHHRAWAQYWWLVATERGTRMPAALPRPSNDLRILVAEGVPVAFRGALWPLLLGVRQRQRDQPAVRYRELCEPPPSASEASASTDADIIEAAEQIERDLDRTWPGHERLDRDALRRVLVAFARSVPEVGYCQGLNSLGATLLLVMSEEDAYWALVLLVTRQLEPGFYSRTLWRSRAEQEVLRALVGALEPKFLRALHGYRFDIEHFCTSWFLCLFAGVLPMEVCMRVWDLICFVPAGDGATVILAAALALLRVMRKPLAAAARAGPAELLRELEKGPAALQPGKAGGGDRFIAELLLRLAWLRERRGELAQQRERACARVRAQAARMQEVRDGTRDAKEARAADEADRLAAAREARVAWRAPPTSRGAVPVAFSGRFSKKKAPAGGAGRTIQPAVGRPSGKKPSLASTDGVGTELNDIGMNARL